jgi:hypothetical protein
MVCSFKPQKTKSIIRKLMINDKTVTEAPDICCEINNFFATIGVKLVTELMKENPTWPNTDYRKYLSKSVKNSLFCEPVTVCELSQVIIN